MASSSARLVSLKTNGLIVLIQAMMLICVVIMSSCGYTCECRRFSTPFFQEGKTPIAHQPVKCLVPPCSRN
ncbi:hypothetical protein ACP70R_000485 [Stipagrostis hirtigluma subsp. patula]